MWSAAVAFLGFVVLGMPGGLLGVAWSPYMVETFQRTLGDIGLPKLLGLLGALLVSVMTARIIARVKMGGHLAAGMLLVAVGLLGYALAPSWIILVGFSFISSFGGGAIDIGLTIYAAAYRSERFMNWLHGCFGLGAALGPLVMTWLLARDMSWRWGYALVGMMAIALALVFFITRQSWSLTRKPVPAATLDHPGTLLETMRLPAVWLNFVMILVYTGLELSAGLWAFSLLISRGVAEETAGLWVSLLWMALTTGRFLIGWLTVRFPAFSLLRVCMIVVTSGTMCLTVSGIPLLSLAGLLLLGFGLAPIYPLMMTLTPQRVGNRHTSNAIGLQTGGAHVGGVLMPAGAGIAAQHLGLEVIAALLVFLAVVMLVLNEALMRAPVTTVAVTGD